MDVELRSKLPACFMLLVNLLEIADACSTDLRFGGFPFT